MSLHPTPLSSPAAPFAMAGSIEPTRLSPAYRAGLVVVALAMLLLPLVYLGLIALVGGGVWWHVTENTGMLHGSNFRWRFLAYLAPAVVGIVVMFFMVKPLLARPAKRREPLQLSPDDEPMLFGFVRAICGQVGAPVPTRVDVDCTVNASAGLVHGVLRRDLALTIGLPLATGLTIRQLGGVLAHEFGHFAQGGGMRLTRVVRGINAWFGRVAYERDTWDEQLEEWSKEGHWAVMLVLGLARGAVWLSRRLLVGLMMAGHAISCFMMRQMEYDADSYEVKVAGSDAFAQTFTRLRELGAASQFAYGDLQHGLSAGHAPGNLPAFITARVQHLPAEVAAHVRATPHNQTGVFDTHPSDADRIRCAEANPSDGVLVGGEAPASQLFANFDLLCGEVTRHHYEHDLGLDPARLRLVSNEAAFAHLGERQQRRQAVHTVLAGCVSPLRPLTVPSSYVAVDPAAALRAARDRVTALATEQLKAQANEFDALETRRVDAFTVGALFEVGFTKVDAASFGLATGTREEAAKALRSAEERRRVLSSQLEPFEQEVSRRMTCGLALVAAMQDAGTDGHARAERHAELVGAFNAVSSVMLLVADLRMLHVALRVVQGNQGENRDASMSVATARLETRVDEQLRRVREAFGTSRVPSDVDAAQTAIATYCGLRERTASANAAAVIESVWGLYFDLLGRIATITMEAEATLAETV